MIVTSKSSSAHDSVNFDSIFVKIVSAVVSDKALCCIRVVSIDIAFVTFNIVM